MYIAPVKTCRRGRPRHAVVLGSISSQYPHWVFTSHDGDLFGKDSIYLAVQINAFPVRVRELIESRIERGESVEVYLRFSGKSLDYSDGRKFYYCKFVGFPALVTHVHGSPVVSA